MNAYFQANRKAGSFLLAGFTLYVLNWFINQYVLWQPPFMYASFAEIRYSLMVLEPLRYLSIAISFWGLISITKNSKNRIHKFTVLSSVLFMIAVVPYLSIGILVNGFWLINREGMQLILDKYQQIFRLASHLEDISVLLGFLTLGIAIKINGQPKMVWIYLTITSIVFIVTVITIGFPPLSHSLPLIYSLPLGVILFLSTIRKQSSLEKV